MLEEQWEELELGLEILCGLCCSTFLQSITWFKLRNMIIHNKNNKNHLGGIELGRDEVLDHLVVFTSSAVGGKKVEIVT